MTHFLQSPAWARFQQALGRSTFTDQSGDWSYLAIKESGTLNTRLYCPYGPAVGSRDDLEEALASLRKLAQREHIDFIRIEPLGDISPQDLRGLGLRPVDYLQLQPEHTQVIDLTPSEDEIVARMAQNNRNLYRNYHKKGLSIRRSNNPADITILTSLLHQVASRTHMTPHNDRYFQIQAETLMPSGDATLYVADHAGVPVAAALVYDSDTTRYYAHAAADDTFRKLGAGTALVAYMIVDAKRQGLSAFDLYGIAPPDQPDHRWAGFTKFKQSFGGSPLAYVGAWDLPLSRWRYRLYRLYQSLRSHR